METEEAEKKKGGEGEGDAGGEAEGKGEKGGLAWEAISQVTIVSGVVAITMGFLFFLYKVICGKGDRYRV